MDSTSMSASTRPPPTTSNSNSSSRSKLSTRRKRLFEPLSVHGMPKTPLPSSPGLRAHRFSTLRSALVTSPGLASPPLTPMSHVSPGPMSPPMSAQSFGTFIESEPSTPAYSPRSGSSNWGSNTLLLLSPVSSASTSTSPASPSEPAWDMLKPTNKSKSTKSFGDHRSMLRHGRSISTVSEMPVPAESTRSLSTEEQKENTSPRDRKDSLAEEEPEPVSTQAEQPSHIAPLNKLATKMKSLMRRKNVGEKKTEKKKKEYEDLDRMENVHWTEM